MEKLFFERYLILDFSTFEVKNSVGGCAPPCAHTNKIHVMAHAKVLCCGEVTVGATMDNGQGSAMTNCTILYKSLTEAKLNQ